MEGLWQAARGKTSHWPPTAMLRSALRSQAGVPLRRATANDRSVSPRISAEGVCQKTTFVYLLFSTTNSHERFPGFNAKARDANAKTLVGLGNWKWRIAN